MWNPASTLLVALFSFAAGAFTQAAETSPSPNLAVEGVPPIPAAMAEQVGRYTDFRSAVFTSWHPSRREMLVTTRFGDTNQAHIVKAPGGARTQLTFYPDRVGAGRFDPATGDSFVFSKDRGGDERFQLHRFDLADGKVTLLTDGKSRNTGAVWSHAGRFLAYGSTRRTGNDVDLYVVDPRDPESDRRVAELSEGGWSVSDWSRDDRRLLVTERISANESYLWSVEPSSGERILLTPKGGEKVAWGNAAFARDGRGLYVTTDRGSEYQRLAHLDLATGKLEFLTPDTADVDGLDVSADGSRIAYVTNEKGASVLRLLDTSTRRELAAPRLPLGVATAPQWHRDGETIGISISSARSPYDAYSVNVRTGSVERWTHSEVGGLNPETFSEPELVSWRSFDGHEITAFLYRPPSTFAGRRPVVIDIHGGPEGQEQPDFRGRDNYLIQELGVAMVYPNIRGSSGYGKTFLALDNGYRREDAYRDIGALLDWIATRPDLDAGRIMVQGGSYGGHMTLAVAALYSDRIRCAVDVVGPSNLVSFLENTSGYRRDLRRVEYGDERDPRMRAFLQKTAPLTNAERIRKPLFIVQGANDPRVPRSESEQMLARIRQVGTPVWWLMAMDEGHGFAKKSNRDYQFFATVLFMKEFLLEKPAE